MTRSLLLALVFLAGCTRSPIALREMGSFHIGGREVEISGKPVEEVVFAPGGVPASIDRNGKYLVEAMYVQYFLPVDRRGLVPLLMWHGGGLTGVTVRDQARRRGRVAHLVLEERLGRLQLRRGGARSCRLGDVSRHLHY